MRRADHPGPGQAAYLTARLLDKKCYKDKVTFNEVRARCVGPAMQLHTSLPRSERAASRFEAQGYAVAKPHVWLQTVY